MNILPILGSLGTGLMSGYMMGNAPQSLYGGAAPQGGAMPATDVGGGVQSSILPGIAPGANVPLQTGSGAGGGMFGGVGQGMTGASAGLFQPQGAGAMFGSGPSQMQRAGMAGMMGGMGGGQGGQGGINPLALALMMNR